MVTTAYSDEDLKGFRFYILDKKEKSVMVVIK